MPASTCFCLVTHVQQDFTESGTPVKNGNLLWIGTKTEQFSVECDQN